MPRRPSSFAPNMENMKNALWFMLGIIGGFVVAHFVNKDPRGHEVLAEVDARISEFADRIGDAYRAQEAKMDGLVADAAEAAKDAATKVVDDAADAAAAARKTAAELTD